MYVLIDSTSHICAMTPKAEYANGMLQVELPDDYNGIMGDYKVLDGEAIYDGYATEKYNKAHNELNFFARREQQVYTFAKMQVASMDLTQDTDDAVANINTLLPDFVQENHEYKTGDSFVYDGKTYRVAQNHTSQAQWKPGDVGTESLYYEIIIANDGILVWRTPVGAHDAPSLNSLRHYPDADGPVYISKKDGNTSVPGTDEWWELM